MSEKVVAEGGSYRSTLILFDNKVLADFFIRYPIVVRSKGTGSKGGESREAPFVVFEKDSFLTTFTDSLGHMLANGKSLSANMQMIKLEELLLYISENYPGQILQLRTISEEADEDRLIRQAVTSNMDHPVTVEELAFLCNTSLSTFKRRFAKIYGATPNKWLLERRMQKAAQLLKQGEYKASEIYYDLGYENLSSFIQSFKQVYGVTPKQYQLSH